MFCLSSRVSYLSLWLCCFYFLIIEAFSCFELKLSKSKTLQNALKEPHWIDAMKKNIQSLHLNKTWVLVPRLVEINVVRSKWVYWIKYKEDSFIVCFKAKLVTKIFTQTLSVDYDKMVSLVDKPITILVTFLKINSPS